MDTTTDRAQYIEDPLARLHLQHLSQDSLSRRPRNLTLTPHERPRHERARGVRTCNGKVQRGRGACIERDIAYSYPDASPGRVPRTRPPDTPRLTTTFRHFKPLSSHHAASPPCTRGQTSNKRHFRPTARQRIKPFIKSVHLFPPPTHPPRTSFL